MIRKLIALGVEQPLVVLFAIVALSILGVHLASDLPIEAFPDVQDVQVQVISLAPGMAPEEVERSVSQPIEREMAGTPRATRVRSVSITGLSIVTVTFADKTNDFFARQQVTDRLSNVTLPAGIQPVLAPLSNAVGEVFRYALEGPDTMSEADVRLVQDWVVRPSIRNVPGVADVVSFGGTLKELQVRVDPAKLARYRLAMSDVQKAVAGGGDNAGAGILNRGDQGFVIRAIALYRTPADVGATAITAVDGKPVRVRDVADVSFGDKPRSGIVSVTRRLADGTTVSQHDRTVEGIVQMLKGGNASDVTAAVRDKVDVINDRLSREYPGMKLVTLYQRTDLIRHTVHTVAENMAVGIVLVVGVLYAFLRRWIPALIVASIIPFALLTALVGMDVLNVPANLMSLGAVDFGVVVDGAVVLVEAVIAMLAVMQGTEDPARRVAEVARIGARTASVILFSMTIIVCAFIPIFTFERVEGRIFTPVALTLSLALVGGLALTLTLVPALLSVALRRRPIDEVHLRWMDGIHDRYAALLGRLIPRAGRVLSGAGLLLAATLAATPLLGTEFLPKLDEGNIWLTVGLDPSSSIDNTKRVEREVRKALLEFPEVRQVIAQVGRPDDGTDPKNPNNLEVLADLHPRDTWQHASKEALIADMGERVRAIPGVLTNFSQVIQDNMEEALSGAKGEVVAKVFGPDLQVLESKGRQIAAVVERIRGAADVAPLPIAGQAEIRIDWDREKLSRYALSPSDANALVQAAFGGTAVATFFDGDRRLDVTLRLVQAARDTVDDIAALPMPLPAAGSDGAPSASVPIGELATVRMAQGAARITREDGQRTITVKMNLAGRDLGSFVAEARKAVADSVQLPVGYRLEWGGQFENQQRAMKRLQTIVPLTLGAILALLFLAFRQWTPALLVLAALPFSLLGGIAALALAGLHLSVSAAVGFIAVAGIAVQNSLIMVQKILDNLRAGMPLDAALVDAGASRVRPILMTATIACLGLLPAALSHGVGAETQRPFALVIVGGVITGTMASLLVLPMMASRAMRRSAAASQAAGPSAAEAGTPELASE